jgi:signal recognition particle subunit SRP54
MTKTERANPQILQASRKKRIAKGAGLEVSDLNKLLKMQRQMSDMMKKMGKMGKGGMLKQAMRGMFGKGEGMPSQAEIEARKRWNRPPARWAAGFPGMGPAAPCPPASRVSGRRNLSSFRKILTRPPTTASNDPDRRAKPCPRPCSPPRA